MSQQETDTMIAGMLLDLRTRFGLSQRALARMLNTSLVSVDGWERGAASPSPSQIDRIKAIYNSIISGKPGVAGLRDNGTQFLAYGLARQPSLFDSPNDVEAHLADNPGSPILLRATNGSLLYPEGTESLSELLKSHAEPARTAQEPVAGGMSAGKNTYTYDAHTYHTKVPPQGIAELLRSYLPAGGLVLDPFAGSGMTGVAARLEGYDCILNELSPAACFIARCFTGFIEPREFDAAVKAVLQELASLRSMLYRTRCRECGRDTELLYTVWSYKVICSSCAHEFVLWDQCRHYGRVVREHKILGEFPCPRCGVTLVKSQLRRTTVQPVLVGYKCCSRGMQEVTHPPTQDDLDSLKRIKEQPLLAEEFCPRVPLPMGVNLRQPMKHGLDSIDKFYTPRNLAAMTNLWQTIHRLESPRQAVFLAFAFTSLYQRVTRLSEFRFWGGSGNTARFNVPYIFNESNVFVTFARKARSIQDHLQSTAANYRGRALVMNVSATSLTAIPDDSIDLVFTDPPFGANINYSEMNLLWESWLGAFTDASSEAIINQFQKKGLREYQELMTASMRECYRVLRPGHWMLLVFMNSNAQVWRALEEAITTAGFDLRRISSFDKQHGTFKQFVSANTAGLDLVLHCQKPNVKYGSSSASAGPFAVGEWLQRYVSTRAGSIPTIIYQHVSREAEIDFRRLYSDWLADSRLGAPADFSEFRALVQQWLADNSNARITPSGTDE